MSDYTMGVFKKYSGLAILTFLVVSGLTIYVLYAFSSYGNELFFGGGEGVFEDLDLSLSGSTLVALAGDVYGEVRVKELRSYGVDVLILSPPSLASILSYDDDFDRVILVGDAAVLSSILLSEDTPPVVWTLLDRGVDLHILVTGGVYPERKFVVEVWLKNLGFREVAPSVYPIYIDEEYVKESRRAILTDQRIYYTDSLVLSMFGGKHPAHGFLYIWDVEDITSLIILATHIVGDIPKASSNDPAFMMSTEGFVFNGYIGWLAGREGFGVEWGRTEYYYLENSSGDGGYTFLAFNIYSIIPTLTSEHSIDVSIENSWRSSQFPGQRLLAWSPMESFCNESINFSHTLAYAEASIDILYEAPKDTPICFSSETNIQSGRHLVRQFINRDVEEGLTYTFVSLTIGYLDPDLPGGRLPLIIDSMFEVGEDRKVWFIVRLVI